MSVTFFEMTKKLCITSPTSQGFIQCVIQAAANSEDSQAIVVLALLNHA